MKMWRANDKKAYWKEKINSYGGYIMHDNRKDMTTDEIFERIKKGGYKSYFGGDELWYGYVSPYSKRYGQAFHFGGKLLLSGTPKEFRELEEKLITIMDAKEIEAHDGIIVLETVERMPSIVFENKEDAMDFAYKNDFEVCRIVYKYDDGTNYIKSRYRGYGLCKLEGECAAGKIYKMIYDNIKEMK